MSFITKMTIEVRTADRNEAKDELQKIISVFSENEVEVTIPEPRTVLVTLLNPQIFDEVLAVIEGM